MPMYNLIEYKDNFSDTSGSLWQLKRDEPPADNVDLGINNDGVINSQSFKYIATLVGKTKDVAGGNSFVNNAKIVVPLMYLSNFWRSLEKPLINCKIHLELNMIEGCILSSAGNSAKFKKKNRCKITCPYSYFIH